MGVFFRFLGALKITIFYCPVGKTTERSAGIRRRENHTANSL